MKAFIELSSKNLALKKLILMLQYLSCYTGKEIHLYMSDCLQSKTSMHSYTSSHRGPAH